MGSKGRQRNGAKTSSDFISSKATKAGSSCSPRPTCRAMLGAGPRLRSRPNYTHAPETRLPPSLQGGVRGTCSRSPWRTHS